MFKQPIQLYLAKKLRLIGALGSSTTALYMKNNKPTSPLIVFLKWLLNINKRKYDRTNHDESIKAKLNNALKKVQAQIQSLSYLEPPVHGTWVNSGVSFNKIGESITVISTGRLFLSKYLEISLQPHACVWYRIGKGNIKKIANQAEIIFADQIGQLEFCIAEHGAFSSQQGELKQNSDYKKSGKIELRLIQWVAPEEDSIKIAATIEPTIFEPLITYFDKEPRLGSWQELWRIGKTDIFTVNTTDKTINCHTQGDIGIIKYLVNMDLNGSLRLSWSWSATQLPSSLPETIRHTHDYLSIAVEFDNGLDLTYMWSTVLNKDTIFQCPLPWWDQRETHWVLRNLEDGINVWFDEERNLLDDYKKAIGYPLPKKVVNIWLIAGSRWQNGTGICQYRSINLSDNDKTITIQSNDNSNGYTTF